MTKVRWSMVGLLCACAVTDHSLMQYRRISVIHWGSERCG